MNKENADFNRIAILLLATFFAGYPAFGEETASFGVVSFVLEDRAVTQSLPRRQHLPAPQCEKRAFVGACGEVSS